MHVRAFAFQLINTFVHHRVLGRKIIFHDLIVSLLIQVNKTHHSEDEMPQVSFFTGRNKASCSATSTATVSGAEEKV